MKMRLRPLRGNKYKLESGMVATFLEKNGGQCKVILNDESTFFMPISALNLPIIDTKDYEKIADEKYRGD